MEDFRDAMEIGSRATEGWLDEAIDSVFSDRGSTGKRFEGVWDGSRKTKWLSKVVGYRGQSKDEGEGE